MNVGARGRANAAMRSRRAWIVLTCVVGWLTTASAALADEPAPVAAAALPPSKHADTASQVYLANDASIVQVFDALASALGKPLVASPMVRRKRASGRFDMRNPHRVLERICADFGLVSYFDGNVVYVYDMSELTNAMGSLRWIDVKTLRGFLDDAGIASPAFPVRGDGASHMFYVAGPPVYVDAVLSAAKNLDHGEIDADHATNGVKVITLKHTFVRDRIFRLRDQLIQVPGVATVLADMLDQQAQVGDTGAQPTTTDPLWSPDDPGRSATNPQSASTSRTGGLANSDLPGALVAARQTASTAGGFAANGSRPDTSLPPLPMPYALPGRPRAASRAIRVSQRPIVLAYPDTNSLLVKGTRDDIDYLSQLISQLDVEKTQIELSLWIIDIQRTTLEQLGVQWQGRFNGGPVGLSFNSDVGALAGGFSTLDGARFLASIFALSSKGEAEIVSRPLILTQENVPALFDNNRTFYAKLIGERTSNLQQVTYGTLVSVIPRLSIDHADIEMILDIEDGKTIDSDTRADTVDGLPVVGRTHISTIARVPREMSLLIGGYTRHEVDNDVTRVPLLGDIPVLGALFRYRNSTATDMVRVFLIQPRVLANRAVWNARAMESETELAPGLDARGAASLIRQAVERSVNASDPPATPTPTPTPDLAKAATVPSAPDTPASPATGESDPSATGSQP